MLNLNTLEQKIADLAAPVIQEEGCALVDIRVKGAEGAKIVTIMAENTERKNLGVDECAVLSREIAALMDVEDLIKGRYRLEVSSPGIDRPLTTIEDFEYFNGFEAKVEIDPPLDGQKRFRGTLNKVENENVIIGTDTGEKELPFKSIIKAKLVLSDDLIKKTKPKDN